MKYTLGSLFDGSRAAELLFLDEIGYSEEDIEIITPEEYDMVFGGDEDG